jgi:hypothetical protein
MWSVFGVMAGGTSIPKQVERMLDAAEQIAERYSDGSVRAMAARIRAEVNFLFGNFAIARDQCDAAAAFIADECRGMGLHRRFVLAAAATCDIKLGELERAQQVAEALRADSVERGDPVHERMACVGALAPLCLAADDPATAAALIARMPAEDRCGNIFTAGQATAAHAMYVDRPGDAIADWRERWPRLKEYGLLMQPLFHVATVHSLAIALLARPEGQRDLREAARLARSIHRHQFPYGVAVSRMIDACLAVRAGKPERSHALLTEAAERCDQVGAFLEAAVCRHRAGELAGESTAVHDAQQLLHARGVVCPERWMTTVIPRLADLQA